MGQGNHRKKKKGPMVLEYNDSCTNVATVPISNEVPHQAVGNVLHVVLLPGVCATALEHCHLLQYCTMIVNQ